MLVANPLTTGPVWPIAGDVSDLNVIVDDQAATIAAQEALLHAYQGVLSAAQAPSPTGATGTATGTALSLTAIVNGPVLIGSTVTGPGIPASPATTLIAQTSGSAGQAGTYTTSQATTCSSASLVITPGGGPGHWPTPQDADTLNAVVQAQTAVMRNQTALLQQYQDLLNVSQTAAPPTGP
jgi:hypothetical protein